MIEMQEQPDGSRVWASYGIEEQRGKHIIVEVNSITKTMVRVGRLTGEGPSAKDLSFACAGIAQTPNEAYFVGFLVGTNQAAILSTMRSNPLMRVAADLGISPEIPEDPALNISLN